MSKFIFISLTFVFFVSALSPSSVAQKDPRAYPQADPELRGLIQRNKLVLSKVKKKLTSKENFVLPEDYKNDESIKVVSISGNPKCVGRYTDKKGYSADDLNEMVESCPQRLAPWYGRCFSFRQSSHTTPSGSDLCYEKGHLVTRGSLVQGMIVRSKVIPLNKIESSHPGVKLLNSYSPVKKEKEHKQRFQEIRAGKYSLSGVKLTDFTAATVGFTHFYRVIAFDKIRANVLGRNLFLNDIDKRDDLVIVFEVLSSDSESTLVAWKEISRKKAPRL